MPNNVPAANKIGRQESIGKFTGSSGRPGGGGFAAKAAPSANKAAAISIFFIK